MKYLCLVFTFIVSSILVGQSGIQWIDNDLELALKKANTEGKMVYLYTYTTWCGPCKDMKKAVFPVSEVGTYYNEAFVNVMMDMEKGKGFEVAEKYDVKAYPSHFFLDASGSVIHRTMGGRGVMDFLELGYAAKDPDRQISTMHKRYEKGERAPAFLKQYAAAISESEFEGFEPITRQYLESQDDWTTAENMQFIFDYSEATIESELFRYTLEHSEAFKELIGIDKVNAKIEFAADRDRSKAGIPRDDVDRLQKHYQKYFSEEMAYDVAMQTYFRQLMYSPDPVERETFLTEVQLYLSSEPALGWNFYNAVAWQVYEYSENQFLLEKAALWAQLSILRESNSYNTDTLAHILARLGRKEEAKAYAKQSIELAMVEGVDSTATVELLSTL